MHVMKNGDRCTLQGTEPDWSADGFPPEALSYLSNVCARMPSIRIRCAAPFKPA